LFEKLDKLSGGDAPTNFYLRRIKQIQAGGPQLDWTTLSEAESPRP
jgi:hypothetical protein